MFDLMHGNHSKATDTSSIVFCISILNLHIHENITASGGGAGRMLTQKITYTKEICRF